MIFQLIGIVLLATVARYAVGAVWFAQKGLFGKKWLATQGVDSETAATMEKKGWIKVMLAGFISTALSTFILALFLIGQSGVLLLPALFAAFLLWLAFIAPTILSRRLYAMGNSYPMARFWIEVSHELVAILVAAAILAWLI